MGDLGSLVVSAFLGLLVLVAAIVVVGRGIGRRMERRHGQAGSGGSPRYQLDSEVVLDAELHARVRDLMRDGERKQAVDALRAATKGLSREDATAMAEAIVEGVLKAPRSTADTEDPT